MRRRRSRKKPGYAGWAAAPPILPSGRARPPSREKAARSPAPRRQQPDLSAKGGGSGAAPHCGARPARGREDGVGERVRRLPPQGSAHQVPTQRVEPRHPAAGQLGSQVGPPRAVARLAAWGPSERGSHKSSRRNQQVSSRSELHGSHRMCGPSEATLRPTSKTEASECCPVAVRGAGVKFRGWPATTRHRKGFPQVCRARMGSQLCTLRASPEISPESATQVSDVEEHRCCRHRVPAMRPDSEVQSQPGLGAQRQVVPKAPISPLARPPSVCQL